MAMTKLYNVCVASPVRNQIIFFDGHGSHFNNGALRQMMRKNIQNLPLYSGDSFNDQPNDNGPNAKLKSCYSVANSALILKYGTAKFHPHHMNYVLVEAYYSFKISAGKIIRDRCAKTKLPPSDLPM